VTELRVILNGELAELGKVPAADVARLLLAVERAVAHAASVSLGRTTRPRGRRVSAVAETARLRLRGIEQGSVIPVLEFPDVPSEESLDLDVETLTDTAVRRVFDTAEGLPDQHPLISSALLQLTEELRIGERYESVGLRLLSEERSREVVLDSAVRQRLRTQAGLLAVPIREETVVGTLVEADFERRTARLRSPDGQAVSVTFGEGLEDEVQEALRRQAGFVGQVVYEPESMQARSVALHAIQQPEQLIMGVDAAAFWRAPSYDDLAEQQGVDLAPIDPDDLYDAGATEEERDAILAAISTLEQ
jgi:hypothetical protein